MTMHGLADDQDRFTEMMLLNISAVKALYGRSEQPDGSMVFSDEDSAELDRLMNERVVAIKKMKEDTVAKLASRKPQA